MAENHAPHVTLTIRCLAVIAREKVKKVKYRKKPVVIEAFKLNERGLVGEDWFWDAVSNNEIITHNFGKSYTEPAWCEIKTLEGILIAKAGDYIIKGVKGEVYPCRADIFELTYELQEPERKWIPITYHEPIEEDGEDTRYEYVLDCQMPDEGEEILVSFNGMVDMDVCCCDDGWYLDRRGDWMDVDAWMPLPEPYKAGEQE